MKDWHMFGLSMLTLGAIFGAAYLWYAGGRDYGARVDIELERARKARTAITQECRQVDDVTGRVVADRLEGWRVVGCEAPRCVGTDPLNRRVYVDAAASDRARHEYVHLCLFAADIMDGHHEWMTEFPTFCHGSPACPDPWDPEVPE